MTYAVDDNCLGQDTMEHRGSVWTVIVKDTELALLKASDISFLFPIYSVVSSSQYSLPNLSHLFSYISIF